MSMCLMCMFLMRNTRISVFRHTVGRHLKGNQWNWRGTDSGWRSAYLKRKKKHGHQKTPWPRLSYAVLDNLNINV